MLSFLITFGFGLVSMDPIRAEQISILADVYACLLSERQQEVLHLYLDDDLSQAEIGELLHISRQAVHDTLQRCTVTLAEYEEKLHLASLKGTLQRQTQAAEGLLTLLPQEMCDSREALHLTNIVSEAKSKFWEV